MNYFKELKEVESVTGWGKLYYNFVDLDRYDSMLMLNYLIDTEPIVTHHCFDEGYEDYLQYSDSFIQEKLIGVTPHLIRKMMDDLVKHEYISVHHAGDDIRRPRYVKLNYEKLLMALGIKQCIKGCINDSINAGANDSPNDPTKNLAQNTITNYQTTKLYLYNDETSSSMYSTSSTENNSPDTSFSKKDTLTNMAPPSDPEEKFRDRIKEIVAYLNEKTDSGYRENTPNTRKHIIARLKQDYTVDDFKHVIDVKCAEWKGTEFEKYLRPDTLFGSKFENYLQQKIHTATNTTKNNSQPNVTYKKANPEDILWDEVY